MNISLRANPIPASENEVWGFIGTLNEHARAAWPIAMRAISDATGQPLESVGVFLDSRHGRRFAEEVRNQMLRGQLIEPAIHAAVARWMDWTISRQTSRQYGIPQGWPCLTGFVIYCAISEEIAA